MSNANAIVVPFKRFSLSNLLQQLSRVTKTALCTLVAISLVYCYIAPSPRERKIMSISEVAMSKFIEEYCSRLRSFSNSSDLEILYRWFYSQQPEIAQVVHQLNERLGIKGTKYEFKPDLPGISVGSTNGILILAANPGWSEESNKKENDYCTENVDNYIEFRSNFFTQYRKVIGHDSRWWTRAMNFSEKVMSAESEDVGGWELIPFHSKAFRGSELFADDDIHMMARNSVMAALRMNPKTLLVASKEGDILIRSLLSGELWKSAEVGKSGDKIYRTIYQNIEIISLGFQLVRTRFKDRHLKNVIENLRQQ